MASKNCGCLPIAYLIPSPVYATHLIFPPIFTHLPPTSHPFRPSSDFPQPLSPALSHWKTIPKNVQILSKSGIPRSSDIWIHLQYIFWHIVSTHKILESLRLSSYVFDRNNFLLYLWMKLLLCAGVTVLACISIVTFTRISPLITMFHTRTWRRPA